MMFFFRGMVGRGLLLVTIFLVGTLLLVVIRLRISFSLVKCFTRRLIVRLVR